MPATNPTIKDYQRRLAGLAGAHAKAQDRLDATRAKRTEVIAGQDEFVAHAEAGVRQAVIDMAAGVGPELTANVLGLDLVEVRRLTKGGRP
jgi:MinD superfamily P-loop ATPase